MLFRSPVFVRAIPNADFLPPIPTCTNTIVNIKSSVQSTDSVSSYKWQLSNGVVLTNKNFSYAFPVEGNYQLTLIAGTKYNCYDTIQKSFTVLRSPNLLTSPDAVLCKDKTLNLTASGALSYSWSPSEGLSCTVCSSPQARPQSTKIGRAHV